MEQIMNLVERFGVPVALLIFFVWRDYKNSQRQDAEKKHLSEKIDKVEEFTRRELMELAEKSIHTVERNTNVLNKFCDQFKLKRSADDPNDISIVPRSNR